MYPAHPTSFAFLAAMIVLLGAFLAACPRASKPTADPTGATSCPAPTSQNCPSSTAPAAAVTTSEQVCRIVACDPQVIAFMAQIRARNGEPRIWTLPQEPNGTWIAVVDSEEIRDFALQVYVGTDGTILARTTGELG